VTGTDAAAIDALIEAWRGALHARDTDALAACCTPDLRVGGMAPPLWIEGVAAQDAAMRAWFASWDGPIAITLRDLRIEADGDVAFASAHARMQGARTDGTRTDLWYRWTVGLRRDAPGDQGHGAGWRIAHAHSSVPFRMDGSYRAEIGLSPPAA
jgi:PhnB protein